ncbi:hypothetical protein PMAYCL1PPCAC_21156, partial [Pristionchus mayeri]
PAGDLRGHPSKGVHLLYFIDYISSNEFRMRPTLSFSEVGGGVLMRGEWRTFSEMALKSYLSLVISHRLDLPSEGSSDALREWEPRAMQLPGTVVEESLGDVRDALAKVSGCQVKLRRINDEVVIVSAIGKIDQLRVLSTFVYPPAPRRANATMKGAIKAMIKFTHERLINAA